MRMAITHAWVAPHRVREQHHELFLPPDVFLVSYERHCTGQWPWPVSALPRCRQVLLRGSLSLLWCGCQEAVLVALPSALAVLYSKCWQRDDVGARHGCAR